MRRFRSVWLCALLFPLPFFGSNVEIRAEEPITVKTEVKKEAESWPVPAFLELRRELETWLASESIADENRRREILSSWPDVEPEPKMSGEVLFDRVIQVMRNASEPVAKYLDDCDTAAWQALPFGQPLVPPQVPLQVYLGESGTKFLYASLRYYLAQRLIQARFYDEALAVLDEMTPENTIDPTGVLLARAVACSRLSQPEKGLIAIGDFRKTEENEVSLPRRRTELAKLLEFELNEQNKDQQNPEQISRQMDDVRRRLGQGRTGKETQESEKDVMKSLDKLIEKIEEQAKKQGGDCEGDQGRQANKPADDSRILKQKGPGNVDRREFDPDGNWGELPPKEREEAIIKIEKEFPPHYRDIIEQYFREMARDGGGT